MTILQGSRGIASIPSVRLTCWVLLLGCIVPTASAQNVLQPAPLQPGNSVFAGQSVVVQRTSESQPLVFQNAPPEGGNAAGVQGTVIQSPHGEILGAPVAPSHLTLQQCVNIGMSKQPTLAAAHSSLGAAHAQVQALNNLPRYASFVRRDLPCRRKQASCGVRIAEAGLNQAVWETRYAITRNYFSVVFALKQQQVAADVVKELELAEEKAKFIVNKGDPDAVVTQADVDKLNLAIEIARLNIIKAETGAKRAKAALREAMGVGPDFPLELTEMELPQLQEGLLKQDLLHKALARRGEIVIASTAAHIVYIEAQAQQSIRSQTAQTFAAGADIHSRPIPQGSTGVNYRPSAIGLEMPTLLVGRKCDRVQRVQALARRADAVVAKTRQLIGLEVADAFLQWEAAKEKITRLKQTPEKAAKLLKTTKARFKIGAATAETLLRAQTLDSAVQAAYNEALYDQALALAALERITAGGFVPNYRQAEMVIHQLPGQIPHQGPGPVHHHGSIEEIVPPETFPPNNQVAPNMFGD